MEFNPPPFPGAQPPMPEPEKPSKRKRRKAESGEGQVTKKVVDRQRRFAIIFALVIAIVAAVAVLGTAAPTTFVVKAAGDVEAGVPLSTETHLIAEAMPDDFIEDGALTAKTEEDALALAAEELTGMRVQYPLRAGEQIHPDMFNVELTLSEPLKSDERLVSINATISHAVAAQIKAGDRVDVHASDGNIGAVILNDVEVISKTVAESQYQALASQQAGEKKDARAEELLPGAPIPGIYVVKVPAADAPKLTTANVTTELSLIYRGEDAAPLDMAPATALSIICGGGAAAALPECTKG